MATLHFRPEKVHLLKWFKDSPHTGDPKCICSYVPCGKVIAEGEMPLRAFRDALDGCVEEVRLHMDCAGQVILEMAPRTYEDHLKFQEGQTAQRNGVRRGANPCKPGVGRAAWWAGWDAAWNKRNA